MGELKTKKTQINVDTFLASIEDNHVRNDCKELKKIFSEVTNEKPIVWSNGVIGFGVYSYKSDRSTQEGEWFITGFSPRKQFITIYIIPGVEKYLSIVKQIGKYKISGKSCVNIKKLSDIHIKILKDLINKSYIDMKKEYMSFTQL